MAAKMPGKNLSNTQTSKSSSVVNQGGTLTRGPRQDPPTKHQPMGKGLKNTQTQNSSSVVRQSSGAGRSKPTDYTT